VHAAVGYSARTAAICSVTRSADPYIRGLKRLGFCRASTKARPIQSAVDVTKVSVQHLVFVGVLMPCRWLASQPVWSSAAQRAHMRYALKLRTTPQTKMPHGKRPWPRHRVQWFVQ
jgi:hypothetical protein